MSGAERRITLIAALLILAIGGVAPAQIVNEVCPVLADEAVDPEITLEWQGRTIGFCCTKCVRFFEDDPEAYAGELPPLEPGSPLAARPADAAADVAKGADSADEEEHGALMRVFARSHPIFVHFPIALLIAAALAEWLGRSGEKGRRPAAHLCVNLAAVCALLAAASGWEREESYVGLAEAADLVERHRWLGVSTAVLALVLAVLARGVRANGQGVALFRWGLVVAAVLVGFTGHAGGQLVYGLGFPFG